MENSRTRDLVDRNATVSKSYDARSYNHKQFLEPSTRAVLPFWQFWTVGDDRVCRRCKPLDRFTARWDDPIWGEIYPKIHQKCRCGVVPILPSEAPGDALVPGHERLRDVLPIVKTSLRPRRAPTKEEY